MMKSLPRARISTLLLAVVTAVTLGMAGCKLVTTSQATVNMHVSVEIQRYLVGNTHISIRFSDSSNNTIEFVSGETVACDGQFLRYAVGFYVGDVPKQPGGGKHTITYTPAAAAATPASSAPVSFSVQVIPSAVTFVQPANGATVAIPSSAPLSITYQPSTLRNTSVYATATDSRFHVTLVLPQPDNGTLTMPADNFADFQAGPGTIALVRLTTESIIST
jgi:hypothetical protein